MARATVAVSDAPRGMWLITAGAIGLSIALHVVPQLLRDWFDPAWSMLVLMLVDACVVALIIRSRTALLVGVLLAALLAVAVWSHQQILAVLPSVALNLMLASVFGATLRAGETPLIVRHCRTRPGRPRTEVRALSARTDAGVGDIFRCDGRLVGAVDAVCPFRMVVALRQRACLASDRCDVHRGVGRAPPGLQGAASAHAAKHRDEDSGLSKTSGSQADEAARRMTSELLIGHRAPDARIAVRAGAPIGAGQFVADVMALAQQLPPAQYVLNSCRDRYLFAVGFCAALITGRTSLLPPSRAPEVLAQLSLRFPDTIYLTDEAGHIVALSGTAEPTYWQPSAGASAWPPPAIAREHVAAIAFTSGSTGEPQPQLKTWGGVADGARAETVALQLDEAPMNDVVLIGTVSPQHMYGFESTVLMALHGPCAFAAEHPLHPDEVRAVTTQIGGRRVLITAPVHLWALAESARSMPALDRVVSATAPLALELAQRCESMWDTRVFEVYGCTETGMVATRRTVDGPVWTTMRDVRIEVARRRVSRLRRSRPAWTAGGSAAADHRFDVRARRPRRRCRQHRRQACVAGRAEPDAVVDRRCYRRRDLRAAARGRLNARAALDCAGRCPGDHAGRVAGRAARADRCGILAPPIAPCRCVAAQRAGKIAAGPSCWRWQKRRCVRAGVNRRRVGPLPGLAMLVLIRAG